MFQFFVHFDASFIDSKTVTGMLEQHLGCMALYLQNLIHGIIPWWLIESGT